MFLRHFIRNCVWITILFKYFLQSIENRIICQYLIRYTFDFLGVHFSSWLVLHDWQTFCLHWKCLYWICNHLSLTFYGKWLMQCSIATALSLSHTHSLYTFQYQAQSIYVAFLWPTSFNGRLCLNSASSAVPKTHCRSALHMETLEEFQALHINVTCY